MSNRNIVGMRLARVMGYCGSAAMVRTVYMMLHDTERYCRVSDQIMCEAGSGEDTVV